MIFPKVRLTLTRVESALLRPGLNPLNRGLSTGVKGDFPDFYAEALGHYGRAVHPDRRFDLEMAGRIPSLHEQLASSTSSRKVRLDLFDIATAQFALRLLKASSGTPHDTAAVHSLSVKLEKYRKRAKRRAENSHGKTTVSQTGETWRTFVSWCRVNLVLFRVPARNFAWPRKGLWAKQRSLIADMIKLAMEERCYAPLNGAQIKRMVRLIKEELHRGRHPVTLRELLTGEQAAGRALLFKLVVRKMKLSPLAGAELSISIAASERGERFEAAATARRGKAVPRSRAATKDERVEADLPVELKIDSHETPCPVKTVSEKQTSVSGTMLPMAIANWLKEYIDPELWQLVTEEVKFAIRNGLVWGKHVPTYDGISDLILKSRPPEETYDWTGGLGQINHPAEWLITWLTKLQPNPEKAYSAVLHGYGNALQVRKAMLYN
jgi:hypothetical protein